MKFYIAGRYQRRAEFQGYAKQLEEMAKQFGKPCECTARWLTGDQTGKPPEVYTHEDKMDILISDFVFFITEKTDIGYNTGGRHVELGFVQGLNVATSALTGDHTIHYAIVGPRENDFMHEACSYFEDWSDMLIQLGKEWKAEQYAKQTSQITGLN